MAIKIVISNHVKFQVKGRFVDSDATAQDFDFWLTARRLSQEELDQARLDLVKAVSKDGNHKALLPLLTKLVIAWDAVTDEKGEPVAFTAEGLAALAGAYPNLSVHVWRTYQDEIGVKEKN